MRIGLYGLPTAGKTTILNQIDFAPVLIGSGLLHRIAPSFSALSDGEQCMARRRLAQSLQEKDSFLMDGHYAFGEKTVFTAEDGSLYDVFLYLYISPEILQQRMELSPKNRKYSAFDIAWWQQSEIEGLRAWCHRSNKDFYVLDNPPRNSFTDVTEPISFIRAIMNGYSCARFARECANEILSSDSSPEITLTDGDRTLTKEDSSSAVFQYSTHLFDGNFYTGYQAWKQGKDFSAVDISPQTSLPIQFSKAILDRQDRHAYILTSGHPEIWKQLSSQLRLPCFGGNQMCADTKFFITKFLQEAGRTVTAYGDSMNDYYMLKQAERGYLVTKPNGSISRSLNGKDLGGIKLV